jgi:hypothetical protein
MRHFVPPQKSYGDMRRKHGDANDHQKLLEPPPTLEKIANSKKNELVCGRCKKIGHTK